VASKRIVKNHNGLIPFLNLSGIRWERITGGVAKDKIKIHLPKDLDIFELGYVFGLHGGEIGLAKRN
jgi:hypothetical protein